MRTNSPLGIWIAVVTLGGFACSGQVSDRVREKATSTKSKKEKVSSVDDAKGDDDDPQNTGTDKEKNDPAGDEDDASSSKENDQTPDGDGANGDQPPPVSQPLPDTASCTPSIGRYEAFYNGKSLGAWLGADVSYSINLSPRRTFWVFGDTFVGGAGANARAGTTMVGNTVGISDCSDGQFNLNENWRLLTNPLRFEAFFYEQNINSKGHRYWTNQPFLAGNLLYIPLTEVANVSGGLGFKTVNNRMAVVTNPDAAPGEWNIVYHPFYASEDFGFGAVVNFEKHTYFYLTYTNDLIMIRIATDFLAGHPEHPSDGIEYLSQSGEWKGGLNLGDMKKLGLHANSGLTVRWHKQSSRWLAVFANSADFPFKNVVVSWAKSLTGPWSEPQTVFPIPEATPGSPGYRSSNLCYAAYEHPHFTANPDGEIAFTYNCNNTDLNTLVNDLSLYYPRFRRIPMPSPP